ncbi:MAG: DegT/DnrJ/EryC1/StrS family aminotransferase [Nitrosospira sp.]|nr:DegT/DnrJ/EryC1/StrS family aminotransferase [Nitrosospira sp.]
MHIPFVDLHAQYLTIKSAIDKAIADTIKNTSFIGGAPVENFERSYAEAYEAPYFVSCANGTDAIYIALKMIGIGPGDEVITTAHSWISTSEVITQAGAKPVFVDVDEFYHLDVTRLETAITPATKAIIPVHLFGQPVDMPTIMSIAEKHGLKVIEDCAQAHFAEIAGRRVGTIGDAGTFSFYPGKNLGAYGDAGGVSTCDKDLAELMRMYARHGALRKHEHQMEGINSRLDGLQAAILSVKLDHIHDWTKARQTVAGLYDELLGDIDGISIPRRRSDTSHVFHLYVVQVDDREQLQRHLREHGIQTGIHYPTALPYMPAYRYLGSRPEDFPNACRNQDRILSLPIFPEITNEQVEYVVSTLKRYVRS